MEYIDTLKKYMSGKNYANKMVRSTDGTTAYITSTGVSKVFSSNDDYNATIGKNNCPTNFIQLTPNWSDLGFPVGTMMKSGQSCGLENSYVQASPPETNFDWEYYLQNNADLTQAGITTEQQATNHWNNYGKQEGRLPNASIMTSMGMLGKVGYIDVDTNFHKTQSTPTNDYKSYTSRSNVTGINMEDCSKPILSIRYGDPIIISENGKMGTINSSSQLEFTTNNSTHFFLRPPPGEDRQGQIIHYGDEVCISSSSSSYTSDCGWWGCKVASINVSTNQMEFGPGGEKTTTFKIIPPKGSSYTDGSEIKYGYIFSLMTISTSNVANVKRGSTINCKSGTEKPGMPGGVYRYSGNNIIQYYPTPEIATSWNKEWSNYTDIDCSTYTTGTTVSALNVAGLTNGDTVGCNAGKELPNGVQGGIYRYVDNNILRWYPSGEIASSWNPTWSSNIKWIDCTTYQSGESMSTKMDSSDIIEDIPKFAYVTTNIVKFGSWSESKGTNVFQLFSEEIDRSCDLSLLKKSCVDDCVGIIHSPSNNTWQKITTSSASTDYKISSTMQDIYMKEATVDIQDSSCEPGKVSFIDATLFSNYPQGEDLQMGGTNQCNIIKPPKPYKGKNTVDKAKKIADKYNPSILIKMQQHQQDMSSTMKYKTAEYKKVTQGIQNTPSMDTLEQQYMDMTIFDSQNKNTLILWSIMTVAILGILLVRK
jgi:hypothetical protein